LGIPATDLIHFFDTWHTAQDRLENISPESLKVVGETVIRSLPAIAAEVEARGSRRRAGS
jgi:hypothetical protein